MLILSVQRSLISSLTVFSALLIGLLAINTAHASERAESAWQALAQGATLIDVRTEQEFATEHLDQALNIPLNNLDELSKSLDRRTKIVVYCRSGSRAAQAKLMLQEMGFTKVYNGGGLEEMKASKP